MRCATDVPKSTFLFSSPSLPLVRPSLVCHRMILIVCAPAIINPAASSLSLSVLPSHVVTFLLSALPSRSAMRDASSCQVTHNNFTAPDPLLTADPLASKVQLLSHILPYRQSPPSSPLSSLRHDPLLCATTTHSPSSQAESSSR